MSVVSTHTHDVDPSLKSAGTNPFHRMHESEIASFHSNPVATIDPP